MNIFRHIETPFGSIVYGLGAGPNEDRPELTRVSIHAYPCGDLSPAQALIEQRGDIVPNWDELYAEGARQGHGNKVWRSYAPITINGKGYTDAFSIEYTPGATTYDGRTIGARVGTYDVFTPAARAKLTAWFEENWETIASPVAIATAIEDSADRGYRYALEAVSDAQKIAREKLETLTAARVALQQAQTDEAAKRVDAKVAALAAKAAR